MEGLVFSSPCLFELLLASWTWWIEPRVQAVIGPNVATVMVACGFKTNDKEIMLMSRVTHCLDSILTKTTTTTTTTQDYSLIHSLVLCGVCSCVTLRNCSQCGWSTSCSKQFSPAKPTPTRTLCLFGSRWIWDATVFFHLCFFFLVVHTYLKPSICMILATVLHSIHNVMLLRTPLWNRS